MTRPFIMFDGLDGSGKSTLVGAFRETFEEQGLRIFDLAAWSREHNRLPLPEDCGSAEVVLSAEPTKAWLGAAIREELIRQGTNYPDLTITEAFALDRLILYQRLLIPLRAAGKMIVQDRGVSSSIAYQPLRGVTLKTVLSFPGNQLALAQAPDLLVIARCPVEKALVRLAGRINKKDNVIFEQKAFLQKLAQRYESPGFRRLWKEHCTRLQYLDTDLPLPEMIKSAKNLAHSVFLSLA